MMTQFPQKLSIMLCFLTVTWTAAAQTQTLTYNYSGNPLAIAPASSNIATVAEISVPAGLTVDSVTTQLNIQYPNDSDLIVYLFSARGTRTILLQNNCSGLANIDTTFDDNAQSKFSDFCPMEAGRGPFRPNEPLANSRGEFSGGYWQVVVQNTKSNVNTGTLLSFSITITGTPFTQPTFSAASVSDSASLIADGFVAPGELVSIFGVALGPQQGVVAEAGVFPTSLGGTTVTFDGNPMPILYSSYYQLNVLAPFGLIPGGVTQVRVQTSAGTSVPVQLDILSAAAGLFTMQANGRGQAAAINQDGTLNSATDPAPAGSVIALYATGLGSVTPPVSTGTPAPTNPLSVVNNPVAVVIGGLTASVSFAGLAPGYAGLYQINAQIPPTLSPGQRRIFVVTPNGYSSQLGVYIEVK